MSSYYTKTFGGKIWEHLHSVSPDNNFCNHINRASFKIFSAKKNAQCLA